jgi:hypothetical protein
LLCDGEVLRTADNVSSEGWTSGIVSHPLLLYSVGWEAAHRLTNTMTFLTILGIFCDFRVAPRKYKPIIYKPKRSQRTRSDTPQMAYTCIPPCNRSFGASGPLTRHQTHCRVWNNHERQATVSRRSALSLRSKTAREKLHLARTNTVSEFPQIS